MKSHLIICIILQLTEMCNIGAKLPFKWFLKAGYLGLVKDEKKEKEGKEDEDVRGWVFIN